jgi:formylglycine-generating enzyme required for sulfatase activity
MILKVTFGNGVAICTDLIIIKIVPKLIQKEYTNSYDPEEPGVEKHVQRGGSYLCSDQYCIRYKAGSRGKGETTSACNHLGFRCVKDKI